MKIKTTIRVVLQPMMAALMGAARETAMDTNLEGKAPARREAGDRHRAEHRIHGGRPGRPVAGWPGTDQQPSDFPGLWVARFLMVFPSSMGGAASCLPVKNW